MSCWPACSAWCVCVNDACVPSAVTINAVRFRTPDGRYLEAANGGGGLMVAATVAVPQQPETFLFVAPATWPLSSGSPISLDVCNGSWGPSGFLVRVDHNVKTFPPKDKKSPGLVSYEIGGPGARVFVSGPFPQGYPAYRGLSPEEWTFDIVKMVGGGAAGAGTPINNGDQVGLRINSNWGLTFFFRVTGPQSGAEVHGDGTVGQAGTVFTVEFNEVRSGLGWRPSIVRCQSCAVVTAKVTRAGSGNPINGAIAVANISNNQFSGTTGSDGRTTLVAFIDGANRDCIPAGNVSVTASANRHQTNTVSVNVPDTGSIEVSIQLDCTQVKGKVVDSSGNAVPGVTVYLRDQSTPPKVILDENGSPYKSTTAADGSFVFNCVPHGFVQVWTTAASSQLQHTKVITQEGWTNVTIVVQTTCGNLVGKVTDADTGQPIAGATVTESGGRQTTTDANGCFSFPCLKPAGFNDVFASAPGYGEDLATATVPATGSFDCQNLPPNPVNIKLSRIAVMAFQIRMDWGAQPSDLDSHLSGPIPAGGRFHLFYDNRTQPPVPFVELDQDDTTALGPETITIRRSPANAAGVFVAGDYHYWVHNFSATFNVSATFIGSGAAVTISAVDPQGNLSQVGRYEVAHATGASDKMWHVVNFTIDANGNITANVVQTFKPGIDTDVL